MLATAQTVIEAALARKESLGAHYRSDYPDNQTNTVVEQNNAGIKVKWQ